MTAAWCAAIAAPAPVGAVSAPDIAARVRANGTVRCASVVRPGIAVPTLDGKHWYGVAVDMCRAVAAAVLDDPNRITMRPYVGNGIERPDRDDDVVFLSASQLVGVSATGTAALHLGPVVFHDQLSLLVPAAGASNVAELARKVICVEPGSAADRALIRYFDQHQLSLHEHPFQETDEMRQAYVGGNCDALAGPRSTLASVRADPSEGHPADRILAQVLADDPIIAATTGDARWSQIIWWTFSVLVDAEAAGIAHPGDANVAIPGVPPAVGRDLGLPRAWAHAVLAACGNYAELYDRNVGAETRYKLARGANALYRDGGLIFALSVE